jgi:hypothetical protein
MTVFIKVLLTILVFFIYGVVYSIMKEVYGYNRGPSGSLGPIATILVIIIVFGIWKYKPKKKEPKSSTEFPKVVIEKEQSIITESVINDLPINRKKNDKGLFGFVDKSDNVIIPFQFDGDEQFSEGLAVIYYKAKSCDKHGFIDINGNIVIEPQFEYAESFSHGYALVRMKGKFGFIDKTGKYLIEPYFQNADSFKDNKARVIFNNKQYFINAEGEKI